MEDPLFFFIYFIYLVSFILSHLYLLVIPCCTLSISYLYLYPFGLSVMDMLE